MLYFLKLGGSLITDKTRPYTPRPDKMAELAAQIASAMAERPELKLVIGHGSGSFGHQAASKYGTRNGVDGTIAWRGFAEVWYQATTLNRLVVNSLHQAGLPVITLSPAASITAHDGKAFIWDLYGISIALNQGLLPMIHGDVAFDDERGGTILSTEEIFAYLARKVTPDRILLAGIEQGVWQDFPGRTRLIRDLTPSNFKQLSSGAGGANGSDVTGGMQTKVHEMVALVEQLPGLEVLIFSGEQAGNLREALLGSTQGTLIHR